MLILVGKKHVGLETRRSLRREDLFISKGFWKTCGPTDGVHGSLGCHWATYHMVLLFPRAPNIETKKVRSWGVFRGLSTFLVLVFGALGFLVFFFIFFLAFLRGLQRGSKSYETTGCPLDP